jgi:hypothetical protein
MAADVGWLSRCLPPPDQEARRLADTHPVAAAQSTSWSTRCMPTRSLVGGPRGHAEPYAAVVVSCWPGRPWPEWCHEPTQLTQRRRSTLSSMAAPTTHLWVCLPKQAGMTMNGHGQLRPRHAARRTTAEKERASACRPEPDAGSSRPHHVWSHPPSSVGSPLVDAPTPGSWLIVTNTAQGLGAASGSACRAAHRHGK